MSINLCIFGFGYTARFLTKLCEGDDIVIFGTSRNPEKFPDEKNCTFIPIQFSAKEFIEQHIKPTHILICAPPSAVGDPVLAEFGDYLIASSSTLQSICYLSTTGVYGDHNGEWVNETSQSNHPSISGNNRLAAEAAWLNFSKDHQAPLSILRIAGIYGPYRNALQKIKSGSSVSIFKKDHVFSRIHVEDLAMVIRSALFKPEYADIYNVCDNEPTENTVINDYAAGLLGIPPLAHQPYAEATLSPMAREFFQANKRVSNRKLLDTFKLQLLHPSYREGLRSLFENGQY